MDNLCKWLSLVLWLIALVVPILPSVRCSAPLDSDSVSRARRAATGSSQIRTFLDELKNDPVDLIILLERTRAVSRWDFYLDARKLVSYLLRYYARIGSNNVQLVVATFAADFTVHMNSMETPFKNKCEIWNKHFADIVLIDKPGIWDQVNIKIAYERSLKIFKDFGRPTANKYIWLLTSGDFKDNDPRVMREELENEGVNIVATKIGRSTGFKLQIQFVINDPDHFGGNTTEWSTILQTVAILPDKPNLLYDIAHDCYCEDTFGFEVCNECPTCPCSMGISNDCYCTGFIDDVTMCASGDIRNCSYIHGRTGRYCEDKQTECVKNACANNGTCIEKPNHYECNCVEDYSPDYYCEIRPESPTTKGAEEENIITTIIIASGAGGGGCLLLFACIITVCVCKRKRRRVQTAETGTYTNPTTLEESGGNRFSRLFRSARFKKRNATTTSAVSCGTYAYVDGETAANCEGTEQSSQVEYNNVVPTLPTGLPPRNNVPMAIVRPTVGQVKPPVPDASLKPKFRKAVPSMLLRVPLPFWRATGQEEVTMPYDTVDEVIEPEEKAKKNDDMDLYENSGSLQMPGWDAYIIQLTTTGGLKQFSIIRYDREAYCTTSTIWFLPNKEELNHIYCVLRNCQTSIVISIKAANYRVTKNDGRMIEAFLSGNTPDVLCIGRSKQYLTMGLKTDPENSGQCYQEVKWVRDTLSGQMK